MGTTKFLTISYYFIASHLLLLSTSSPTSAPTNKCKFQSKDSQVEEKQLDALKALWGNTYSAEYQDGPTKKYNFNIGICVPGCNKNLDSDCTEDDGVIQTWKVDDQMTQRTERRVVGRINDTTIKGGKTWKMLTYMSGDKYKTHCHQENRQAHIMFICDQNQGTPKVTVLDENSQRNDSCYYLFEITTKDACPPTHSILPEGVSAGSVLVIVVVVFLSIYFVGGCLYRRIVVGAKGMDQVPNLKFWQKAGNMMADGCDFVCRSDPSSRSSSHVTSPGAGGGYTPVASSQGSRAYKGYGDDVLSDADDSILPM